jgi:hypothetical protein
MAIHTVREGTRSIHMIQDGTDYRELLELVRSGKIETTKPTRGTPSNLARIVEFTGRGKFLVKRGAKSFKKLDARLKYRLFGSPFLSVMRKVERAAAAGCDRVQRIFLIDETVTRDPATKKLRIEMWIVLEFIPGEALLDHPEAEKYVPLIPEALREAHRYKLTQRDCNPDNFIVSDGRVKIIDIHFFSDFFFRQMYLTACKVKQWYGLDVPVDGVANKALFRLCATAHRVLGRLGISRKDWGKTVPAMITDQEWGKK